nr:hypothetical protein [Tanacetum cinerariifolium]
MSSGYPELLSKDNRLDKRTFKYKIPPSISATLMYQHLARHPANVQSFLDPILFLAGLKSSWEHNPQHPAIIIEGKEMAFRSSLFVENDENICFLPCEPLSALVSPSTFINNESPLLEVEPLDSANLDQFMENTVDSRDSPIREQIIVVGSDSVAKRMKSQRCRKKGSLKPPVKRLPDALELETAVDCHLMISNGDKKGRDKECEGLKTKCETAMADFDKNPAVNVLRQKIKSLLAKVKEHKISMDMMAEVVLKVVAYVAMELVHSYEMAILVRKPVSSAVFYGRCAALEEVAKIKYPFDLVKVKGSRPSKKKEYTKAGKDLTDAVFPFLSKVTIDHSALVKALISKIPKSACHPTPTKTNAPAPSAPS